MNLKLYKNDILEESRKYGGRSPLMECLIMIGVFFLVEAATLLVSLPLTAAGFLFADQIREYGQVHGQQVLTQLIVNINMGLSLLLQIIPIGVLLLYCKKVQKRKAWTLGFKKENWLKEYGIGMLVGFAMMSVVYLIALAVGSVTIRVNDQLLTLQNMGFFLLYFLGFLVQGMSEEVICRGYFMISLARKKNQLWMAAIVNSVFFAALHLLNNGITPLAFVNLTLFGLFASLYFIKRGNLWGLGAVHSLWNFTQGNVWGISVSGIGSGPSVFVSQNQEAMTLFNGGTFGLEAGIATTIVLAIGIVVLLKLPQKDVVKDPLPQEVPAEA